MGLDRLAETLGVPIALGEVSHENVHEERRLKWLRKWRLLRAAPTWPMQGLQMPARQDWGCLDFGFPWSDNRFTNSSGPILRHGEALPGFPSWTVLATPGHCDDAICLLHRQAGWLVAGDTMRNFLGGEWNPLQTSPAEYSATREMLEAEEVGVVFPGHGPVFEVESGLASIRDRAWFIP